MLLRWRQYGIGTMFSLAVLSFTVTVAMKMVGAVAASFAAQYMTMMALGAGDSPGVNTMALQRGGLGIFLTVLILSVPPMASSFFQGVLGSFTPQSIFGANAGAESDTSTGAGQGGYRPPEAPAPRIPQSDPSATQGNRGHQYGNGSEKPEASRTNIHNQGSTRTSIEEADGVKKNIPHPADRNN